MYSKICFQYERNNKRLLEQYILLGDPSLSLAIKEPETTISDTPLKLNSDLGGKIIIKGQTDYKPFWGLVSIFIKPQKIPEEEIMLYQEKKICLVCKGKVARFNVFICPDCHVLYCENCARSLSNLENACWVCETAFDESKPVKIAEKEEDVLKIDEEIHKDI